MRAILGDVIGTTNGRYGKIVDEARDKSICIEYFPDDINEPAPEVPEKQWITQAQVASVR